MFISTNKPNNILFLFNSPMDALLALGYKASSMRPGEMAQLLGKVLSTKA